MHAANFCFDGGRQMFDEALQTGFVCLFFSWTQPSQVFACFLVADYWFSQSDKDSAFKVALLLSTKHFDLHGTLFDPHSDQQFLYDRW